MLEAMRSGVTEWVAEPLVGGRARSRHPPRGARRSRQGRRRGKVVRGHRRQGRRRQHDRRGQPRDRASQRPSTQPTLLIDLHLAHGDASVFLGVEPRFSVLDALENIHRLDETYFKGLVTRPRPGLDLLASSEPRAAWARSTRMRVRHADRVRLHRLPLRGARLPALGRARVLEALDAASTVIVVANQELATLRSASRIARRCASAAARTGSSWRSAASIRSRTSRGRMSSGCSAGRSSTRFPSDYRTAVGGAQPRRAADPAESQHAWRSASTSSHEMSPGCRRRRAKRVEDRAVRPAERAALSARAARRWP